jgi:hypothetical protein
MVGSHPRFHAVGTNIVVTTDWDYYGVRSEHIRGLTMVYDTENAAVDYENSLPRELFGHYDAVAADDKLYTFSSYSNGGMIYLGQTDLGIFQRSDEDDHVPYSLRPQQRWTWNSGPAPPPPLSTRGNDSYVWAHALHPDGRTIFVSLRRSGSGKEVGRAGHGDWCLPFKGHGHYDSDLDAWVGTQTVYNEDDCSYNQHLCSCDVPEIGEGRTTPVPAPTWKLAENGLSFLEDPMKSMYGHTLLPMGCTGDDVCGRGGMFFLIERTLPPGVPFRRYISDGGEKCLLRLTMFRAKYGKNGELVAVPLRSGRTYLVSRYCNNHDVSAFWM